MRRVSERPWDEGRVREALQPLRTAAGRAGAAMQTHLGPAVVTLREWRRRWYASPALLVVTVAILAVLPDLLGVSVAGVSLGAVFSVHLLVVTLIWAIAAQGWNLVSGFTGQFSFGHAAFFGLGAYAPLVLAGEFGVNPWLGMLAGGGIAGLYALGIGVLTFRYDVRGSYFVLATLAFAELLLYVFINVEWLGGSSGFVKPLPSAYGAEFGLAAFQFRETLPYYYIGVALLVVVSVIALAVKHSGAGLYLFAIRDNEDAASAVGIPTMRYKLLALVVSAFFTAWAGTLWSMYFTTIRPSVVFGVLVNLDVLLPAVVGGLGTVFGPILGSFVLTAVSELGRTAVGIPELQDVIYGGLLLVIVLKSPGGVLSWTSRIADLLDPRVDRDSETED